MIGYMCGVFDILRAEDLQNLDMQIQLAKQDGAKYFGLGIYEKELCDKYSFKRYRRQNENYGTNNWC